MRTIPYLIIVLVLASFLPIGTAFSGRNSVVERVPFNHGKTQRERGRLLTFELGHTAKIPYQAFIKNYKRDLGLTEDDRLVTLSQVKAVDNAKISKIILQQYHKDILVEAGILSLMLKDGHVISGHNLTVPISNSEAFTRNVAIDKEDIKRAAGDELKRVHGIGHNLLSAGEISNTRLKIVLNGRRQPVLVKEGLLYVGLRHFQIKVEADTGDLFSVRDTVNYAHEAVTGESIHYGTVGLSHPMQGWFKTNSNNYILKSPKFETLELNIPNPSSTGIFTAWENSVPYFSNLTPTDDFKTLSEQSQVEAHFLAGQFYTFVKNRFGRDHITAPNEALKILIFDRPYQPSETEVYKQYAKGNASADKKLVGQTVEMEVIFAQYISKPPTSEHSSFVAHSIAGHEFGHLLQPLYLEDEGRAIGESIADYSSILFSAEFGYPPIWKIGSLIYPSALPNGFRNLMDPRDPTPIRGSSPDFVKGDFWNKPKASAHSRAGPQNFMFSLLWGAADQVNKQVGHRNNNPAMGVYSVLPLEQEEFTVYFVNMVNSLHPSLDYTKMHSVHLDAAKLTFNEHSLEYQSVVQAMYATGIAKDNYGEGAFPKPIVFPLDLSQEVDFGDVEFTWQLGSLEANTAFRFQLSETDDFSSILIDGQTTDSFINSNNVPTGRIKIPDLQADKEYFWRVKAITAAVENKPYGWRSTNSFKTKSKLKTPILNNLSAPNDSADGKYHPWELPFQWQHVGGANFYEVNICENLEFDSSKDGFCMTELVDVSTSGYSAGDIVEVEFNLPIERPKIFWNVKAKAFENSDTAASSYSVVGQFSTNTPEVTPVSPAPSSSHYPFDLDFTYKLPKGSVRFNVTLRRDKNVHDYEDKDLEPVKQVSQKFSAATYPDTITHDIGLFLIGEPSFEEPRATALPKSVDTDYRYFYDVWGPPLGRSSTAQAGVMNEKGKSSAVTQFGAKTVIPKVKLVFENPNVYKQNGYTYPPGFHSNVWNNLSLIGVEAAGKLGKLTVKWDHVPGASYYMLSVCPVDRGVGKKYNYVTNPQALIPHLQRMYAMWSCHLRKVPANATSYQNSVDLDHLAGIFPKIEGYRIMVEPRGTANWVIENNEGFASFANGSYFQNISFRYDPVTLANGSKPFAKRRYMEIPLQTGLFPYVRGLHYQLYLGSDCPVSENSIAAGVLDLFTEKSHESLSIGLSWFGVTGPIHFSQMDKKFLIRVDNSFFQGQEYSALFKPWSRFSSLSGGSLSPNNGMNDTQGAKCINMKSWKEKTKEPEVPKTVDIGPLTGATVIPIMFQAKENVGPQTRFDFRFRRRAIGSSSIGDIVGGFSRTAHAIATEMAQELKSISDNATPSPWTVKLPPEQQNVLVSLGNPIVSEIIEGGTFIFPTEANLLTGHVYDPNDGFRWGYQIQACNKGTTCSDWTDMNYFD